MSVLVDTLLLLLALVTLVWGVRRYRTRFVRTDLYVALTFSLGLALMVFVPTIYDWLGNVLDIQSRVVTISLFANAALLLFSLYIMSLIRKTRSTLAELTRTISIEQAPRTDGGQDTAMVVIPAYNEERTIRSVVTSLPDAICGHQIVSLVVSDGSADDTARRAEIDGTLVVEHPVNQGQGGALKTGFEIATEYGADVVVTMDADGQHPASELERLVRPIVDDEADFVIGSRYEGNDYTDNSTVRRAGIWAFTHLINVLTKSDITDCTNGFRAIRGGAIGDLTLTEERFSAPELIIEARKHGLRIREIPITVAERQAGETKKPQLSYALGLARTILVTWVR